MGGRVGDCGVDNPGIESELLQQVPSHIGIVGFVAVFVQCSARGCVPGVEMGHIDTSQSRADTHHRPAIRPLALPRVFLAFNSVYLFEAEEPPVDREVGLFAYGSYPA